MDASQYKRLMAIQSLNLLDTEAEAIFDDAVLLASTICGTPMSLVTILDDHRQWFKARVGVELTETPLEHAFCKHAIAQEGLFIVGDARLDSRFHDNPLVTGVPGIRFYAGMPLVTADSMALGTLCVIDIQPRELTDVQTASLKLLAKQLIAHIEMRTRLNRLHQTLMEIDFNTREISSNNALFLAFMDNSPMVGYMKDEQRRLIYYNQPFANHYGITRTEWLKKTDFDIYPLEFALRYQPVDDAIFEGGELVIADQTSPAKDGSTTYWRAYKFPFQNEAGERFIAGMSLNVTTERLAEIELQRSHEELNRANALLRTLSITDPLTGLCNRRGFDDRMLAELSLATRYRFDLSVLLFDVDNFKSINDTFGHEAGDQVLQQIANILSHSCRTSDLACRFGGEEFAFLLPFTSLEHGVLLADRIRQKIQDAVWELRPMTVSVGVSANGQSAADCATIMRRADLALYAAKSQGKNRVLFYTPELESADQPVAVAAH